MKGGLEADSAERHEEIAALIESLHRTEQRLEDLTAGEVDTVANQAGRTFLLQRAQEYARRTDAERQAAILNALPAHIALLDAQGVVVSVNDAWRRFADENLLRDPAYCVGRTYVDVCTPLAGSKGSAEGRRVAEGVLAVLAGARESFCIEYPCHTAAEQRWFLMTATPLETGRRAGAIVMHVNISERARAERETLRIAGLLRAVVDGTTDAIYVKDLQGRYLLCNHVIAEFTGRTVEQVIGQDDTALYSPEEAKELMESDRRLLASGHRQSTEKMLTGVDGSRCFHATKSAYRNERGEVIGVIGIARDVTDRRRIEQELRDSQALLGIAGRLGQVGGWSVDIPPTQVVWTDTMAVMHEEPPGFSPSVKAASGYDAPEHAEMIRVAFSRCAEEGTPIDMEYEIITARGRRVWVHAIGETVRDAKGVIRRVQGALQDLTERKHAERLTGQLAVRLTDTLESITDAFFAVDREWRYTYVNAEAERVLEKSRESLIGRVIWEVFPEAIGTVFESSYRRAMAGERDIAFEAVYAPWDQCIGVNCYPTAEGLSVYFRDVTVKRAARLQLELLEAGVARLNDIVLITDAAPLAAPGPRIVFVNDAFSRVTGYARDEVLGKSPRLLHGPLTDRAELDRLRAALDRFEPVHAELLNYRKNGQPYWIEMDIVPVGSPGQGGSHFVAIQRDITERKRHQDALSELNAGLEARVIARTEELNLAREQAEHANRAKSSFLATISHEIRTPMNGVIGMIDVLEESNLRPSQLDMVKTVRESAYALLNIVDDVLDFSKIEAGQFQIDHEPMNVETVVEGVCDTLDRMSESKGVTLRLFTDPALPPQALGDATRLRQVLLNLVGNAVKFSSGQGRQGRVAVRARVAGQVDEQVMVDLIVIDNGIGMGSETLSTLFSPFTQADAGTTRLFGGTGLGLSISHRLVDLMDGTITVRSKPGKGSIFTVRLPMTALASAGSAAQRGLAGLCCMVLGGVAGPADDFAAYLSHAGASVQRAQARGQAEAWLRGVDLQRCVLIIANADEPVEAALAACRTVCRGRPKLQLSFVVVQQGQRRKPRFEAPDVVSLDGEALHRTVFLRAVAQAAGEAGADRFDATEAGFATRPTPLDGLARRATDKPILVAEDNPINQQVLERQLALLGFKADIANDGQEALDRWRRGNYGLLLTDLHMPTMDGYSLTAAIRSEEPAGERMPIMALTANALRDEETRCLAAGMDAYLSKPVRLAQLRAALESWLGPSEKRGIERRRTPQVDGQAPVDLSVLAALIGDDPQAIDEVLQAFRASSAQSSDELKHSMSSGSTQAVADVAHKLKSAARSIGALRLGDICADLEQVAATQRAAELSTLLLLFNAELLAVQRFLDAR